ncbi:unnamed protein product [Psylliodes chrysocephalus]|uniref:Uncharacterized protein n=1 Tax=Psylliodes chrysocephalus TaxID=3402493 RepID=A0A9P0CXS8_9CUCU|nr:unnamed protein product [Psylliodes chrysocephala]
MNVPRYEFCEENKQLLLNFIKKSNKCKSNVNCNIAAHNNLSNVLPLKQILDKLSEETEIIDIVDSDEEQLNAEEANEFVSQILQNSIQPFNETVADDISDAIKEILQSKKTAADHVISDLHKHNLDLVNIFKQLFEELSFENVIDLGILLSSHSITNDEIILSYVRHMLIKQLALEYSDKLQDNLNIFCIKYPEILTEELSNYILSSSDNYSRATLQFIDGLSVEFKNKLLRNFVLNCKSLEEYHLAILDILLVDQTEINTINRLVELMSKSAENYSTNKVFGKFLHKVVQFLEKNVCLMEKPMNHIIGNHKSIWKVKIKKIYDGFMQDSLLMSQTLRD